MPANQSVSELFEQVRSRIQEPTFLDSKGLANEVSTYVLPYNAKDELEVRRAISLLARESAAGKLACTLHVADLWETLLKLLEGRGISPQKVAQLEERRGPDFVFRQVGHVATPQAMARAMDWQPHEPKDVLLICGVGKVYPFLRASDVFNNAQTIIDDVPIILAYPGAYTGRELQLFGKLDDANYYRAFNLIA